MRAAVRPAPSMRARWLRLLFACWTLLALALLPTATPAQALAPIPRLDSPVVDTTGTLDAAARAFDQWKLGREEVDDGILVVAALRDRRVRIEVGYGLEGAIPDATAARVIQEYIVPRFREGDIAGGLIDGTAVLTRLVEGEPLPAPMASPAPAARSSGGGGALFALFAAFFVAQVARGVFGIAPRPLRGLLGAGAAGGIAWLLSSLLVVGVIGALIGALFGFAGRPAGRYARHRGYGGLGGAPIVIGSPGGFGGFGGGGGGFGGGGWSGGGGMSGGGGASGSW